MKTTVRSRSARVAAVLLFISTIVPVLWSSPASATACRGVLIKPGMGIRRVVDNHGPGTTFCLARGTYRVSSRIHAKTKDTFIGISAHRRGVVVKTKSAQVIFELGGAHRVTLRHFTIKGARNRCPGHTCGETGRAISRGSHVTVARMHLYNNGLNAIGGTAGRLVVRRSEIDHNGASTGDGQSAGIKSTDALTVLHSHIHHNRGNGVWCDVQCGDFVVRGSRVGHNWGSGIFDEISQGVAVFRGNKIKWNNRVRDGFRGGLSITNSKNVVAYNNVFKRNKGFGIAARMDGRVHCGSPDSECGYIVSNVHIHDNILRKDSVVGCSLSGVSCFKNGG